MFGAYPVLCRCVAIGLLALTLGMPTHRADADAPNQEIADPPQALDFIDHLAAQAFATMNDRSLTEAERNQRFRTYLDRGFNTRYIALMALGPYCRNLSESQLADYEMQFSDYLFTKYSTLVETANITRFRTVAAQSAGPRDALVTVMVSRPGDTLDTEWRVRVFDGELRVIDVKVEGLSLTMSVRDEFETWIKRSGLQGLMTALRSYSVANRA